MVFGVYFLIAWVVWCIALLLTVSRRTRPMALKIAAGMAGSFPGVFLFQILAAPFILLILLSLNALAPFNIPDGAKSLIAIVTVLLIFSIAAIFSLYGFYVGWRFAWELAAGRSPRLLLTSDKLLATVFKRLPFIRSKI